MVTPPDIEAQILRFYHAEKWTVGTIAHQLHGAIGVTAEHPLWSATMRAQSWTQDYATTASYARRLGRMALAATDPWDLVIGNLD